MVPLIDLESYKIIGQEEKITIDEEEYFENLNQLVEVGELRDYLDNAMLFSQRCYEICSCIYIH